MNTLRTSLLIAFASACAVTLADDLYFGGSGDTNTHWVGYQVSVATNSITWTAYTLDPAKRGRIKIAPATLSPVETNRWTAIFDEHVFGTNTVVAALASHDLLIISRRDGESIWIRDGKAILDLLRMSPEDLRTLKSGRIPNTSVQSTPTRVDGAAGRD